MATADGDAAGRRRPNVVVFFTDQQRWDTLGVHGNPLDLTPNLDRMAGYGTHFEHAFTTNPVCAPARAAIQTGRYPTSVGVHRNGRALGTGVPTMATWFGAAGYATGYIGKWHLAPREPVVPARRGGYQHWLASNILEFTSDAYRTIVSDEDGQPVFLPGYRSDALTDAAIRFVADHVDEPFLLFLSFVEPHQQNESDDQQAPDGYAERYSGRWLPPDLAASRGSAERSIGGYYGQVRRLDECLGRLRDALRSMDLSDDTIIVFTSDHGSHFKTRNDEYKRSCHDASVRVPLVCTGGPFTAGGRHPELVSTVDLAPTLLEAAGLPLPDDMQGHSLVPIVRGTDDTDRSAVLIQISGREIGRAVRTQRWKYYARTPNDEGRRTNTTGATIYEESELYDLAADPYEQINLIRHAHFDEVATELGARLVAMVREIEGVDVEVAPATRRPTIRRPAGRVDTSPRPPRRFGHQPRSPQVEQPIEDGPADDDDETRDDEED